VRRRSARGAKQPAPARADPQVWGELVTAAKKLRVRLGAFGATLGGPRAGVYDGRVDAALKRLKAGLGSSPDIAVRPFRVGGADGLPAVLVFSEGLVDNRMVDADTLALAEVAPSAVQAAPAARRAQTLARCLAVGHVTYARKWSSIEMKVLQGNALVLVAGADRAIVLDVSKYPARSIPEPEVERSILGSHEAFNEVILTHMNQVRLYLQTPALRFESHTVGRLSGTNAVIAYIDGVTNPALIQAVRRRITRLRDGSVVSAARLASSMKDHTWTPFPLVRMTPRVDFVARELLEGRVAVLTANTPFAIVVPATFLEFYRTSDDYEGQFWGPTMNRAVRLLGFFVALYAPALYIAMVDVNPDFLPTHLLWTVAGSREGLPFPPQVEVVLMFAIIELLREAAIRMPKSMSGTLGTVGAIIIGTSIVKAGVVSTLMIVVVTLTAVAIFTSPTWEITLTLRWIMWPMVVGAYFFGMVGIVLVTILVVLHMASLSSFGVPYLTPFGPLRPPDWGDTVVRVPLRDMDTRPSDLYTLDARTQPPPHRDVQLPDVPLASARRART